MNVMMEATELKRILDEEMLVVLDVGTKGEENETGEAVIKQDIYREQYF